MDFDLHQEQINIFILISLSLASYLDKLKMFHCDEKKEIFNTCWRRKFWFGSDQHAKQSHEQALILKIESGSLCDDLTNQNTFSNSRKTKYSFFKKSVCVENETRKTFIVKYIFV